MILLLACRRCINVLRKIGGFPKDGLVMCDVELYEPKLAVNANRYPLMQKI